MVEPLPTYHINQEPPLDEELSAIAPLNPYSTTPQRRYSAKHPNPSLISTQGLQLARNTSIRSVEFMRRVSERVVGSGSSENEEVDLNQYAATASVNHTNTQPFPRIQIPDELPISNPQPLNRIQTGLSINQPDPNALLGNSLGIFGPNNGFRKALAKGLQWWGTEPIILVLILLSTIVFTIQSSYNVYEYPRPEQGFFHSWEDYALFILFVAFTFEMIARIVVTGLVKNTIVSTFILVPSPSSPVDPPHTPLRSYPENSAARERHISNLTRASIMSGIAPDLAKTSSDIPRDDLEKELVQTSSLLSEEHASIALKRQNSSESVTRYPPSPRIPIPPGSPVIEVIESKENNASSFLHSKSSVNIPSTSNYHDRRANNFSSSSYMQALSIPLMKTPLAPFAHSIREQRAKYHTAYLRHSWNRLDLLAVVSFWISFALSQSGLEKQHNLWFFRALSVLRVSRLLAITEGTNVILHSLKKAMPQLVNLGFFVMFAMTLFSIIGVQAFEGSYRRNCVWIDPLGQLPNVTWEDQRCGGHIDVTTGLPSSYLNQGTWTPTLEPTKGYLCPAPSVCVETENPANGAYNFDNFAGALLQVVIIGSANTWTGFMYNTMDADYFISCIFFVIALLTLNYWLINMFVAVITNTFDTIKEETSRSAFSKQTIAEVENPQPSFQLPHQALKQSFAFLKRAVLKTRYFWVFVVLLDVCIQASRSYWMSEKHAELIRISAIVFAIAFDLEILFRFLASLPTWKTMIHYWPNAIDLFLAVATTIIQIPPIPESVAYRWLTFFQLMRFYRVILAIPRINKLFVRVLQTYVGLFNMILFMILMTYLASLIAVTLFRGLPESDAENITFYQFYNSYLGMYQLLSSENWTTVLGTALEAVEGQFQLIITSIFMCGWLYFAFFIMMNMFIAVLKENFSIPEAVKHKLQLEEYKSQNEPLPKQLNWFQKLNPYRHSRSPTKDLYLDDLQVYVENPNEKKNGRSWTAPTFIHKARKALGVDMLYDTSTIGRNSSTRSAADSRHDAHGKSLFIFNNESRIRILCQQLVEASSDSPDGNRRVGHNPERVARRAFQIFIFACIIASVTVIGLSNPGFRRLYMLEYGTIAWAWFDIAEAILGMAFIFEFVVKVIADGFVWGPHAYIASLWNVLDFAVLLTMIVNIVTSLVNPLGYNRFTRVLAALRALRLINAHSMIRSAFYTLLIQNMSQILDASALALLYIIPFAVWATNIFNGQLFYCTDDSVTTKAECVGEYMAEVIDDWSILMPRVWQNPQVWSFDDFKSSLLILFEIISLEGWTSVFGSVMHIKGVDLQPQRYASQWNALFFVLYNLIGAALVLTLFLSVILEGFTRRNGTAYLTVEQRQWRDLQKMLSLQHPSKRPKKIPENAFRKWCYQRATQKHGWWANGMTCILVFHIAVLMSQAYNNLRGFSVATNFVYLFIMVIFVIDIFIRFFGLGVRSFVQSTWCLYDTIVAVGTIATTILRLVSLTNDVSAQFQKLFLVLIAFKLVHKVNSLNTLFKTALASLPSLLQIFGLWVILFLVWTIAYLEVFGLTRWGPNGTRNMNYSSFGRAIVMLVLQSSGEGWNAFMHDYTLDYPICTASSHPLNTDCGSPGWAYVLFMSWNVLSMYLMGNLILATVIENFSYVFQNNNIRVKNVSREDMRALKKVWAIFDPDRTGYLKEKDMVKFFGSLIGIFEVKIYPDNFSVSRLCSKAVIGDAPKGPDRQIDMNSLRLLLSTLSPAEIRSRRERYNRLYYEARMDMKSNGGRLSFHKVLVLLAHHCLIDDWAALTVSELVNRREKLVEVDVIWNISYIQGLLQMMISRSRFQRHLDAQKQERSGAPVIVLESS